MTPSKWMILSCLREFRILTYLLTFAILTISHAFVLGFSILSTANFSSYLALPVRTAL
jgi:hypothetical protein